MSNTESELILFDRGRALLTGLVLPSPPPARIYISGSLYQVAAPRVPLPPIINTVKAVLNWASTAGGIARNILHFLIPSGAPSSDPAVLQAVADAVMTNINSGAPIPAYISSSWSLQNVMCHDLGGTSASASSTLPAIPGAVAAAPFPPGVAVAVSWQIAPAYRGGKPRTYLPGIPVNAVLTTASSQLSTTYANGLASFAHNFLTTMNSTTVPGSGSSHITMGAVSYYHGHAVRPTPIFNPFIGTHVHERIDSQRRRNGKEASFPVTP